MATCAIEVYIKLPSGKAISARHAPTDTVRQVAAFVAKGEGVSEARLRLKYQGKTLDKSKTIGYLGVCAETILKGEILFPKDMTIYVTYPDGRCDPLLVQNIDTVLTLKKKIDETEGIPPNQQSIKLNNGVGLTQNDLFLCDVGVTNESVIVVKKSAPAPTPSTADTAIVEEEVDEEKKQDLIDSFNTGGRNVEVVFCFDTTGSMYSCLDTVRQKLRESCERLLRDIPNMRIGIIAHGDYCDFNTYVTRYVDLTADVDTLVDFAENVPRTGGGDSPEVRHKLRETCSRLLRDVPNMRIGIMANGDYCDAKAKYAVRYLDLTTDVDTLVKFTGEVAATGGGGNGGECYEWALRKAQQLDWSEESAKALVMIGDELPHAPAYTDQNLFWMDELDVLGGMGVKVYGVQALNQTQSKPFYEELAERTNGYYLQLKNFNLITDMFLAVCYREADPEQLEAFVEEVENAGRMTEDTQLFMKKLEEEKPDNSQQTSAQRQINRQKRYVAQPWWDPTLESSSKRPEYVYLQETDSWANATERADRTTPSSVYYPPSSTKAAPKKSRLRKFLCF